MDEQDNLLYTNYFKYSPQQSMRPVEPPKTLFDYLDTTGMPSWVQRTNTVDTPSIVDKILGRAFPDNTVKISTEELVEDPDAPTNFKALNVFNFKALNPKNPNDTNATNNAGKISLTDLIKPTLAVGSLLGNLYQLKKTKEAAKNIKSPDVTPVVIQNRPVKGLDPEIVSQYKKRVGNLNVKKTSDPISNRIAEQMLTLKKIGALEDLSTKQVEQLHKETVRRDKTEAANRVASIKARNLKAKYMNEVYNKKAAIDAAYEAKKQDFINRWIEEGIVKPVDKKIAYNLGKKAIQENADWNRLQAAITNAQNRANLEPMNESLRKQLDILLYQQQNFEKRNDPEFIDSMNKLFK